MSEDEELFSHVARAWTAGELRKALDGVPGDLSARVVPAEEPGGDLAAAGQVVISAGPWNDQGTDGAAPDHFEIGCEFPSGRYYRRRS